MLTAYREWEPKAGKSKVGKSKIENPPPISKKNVQSYFKVFPAPVKGGKPTGMPSVKLVSLYITQEQDILTLKS